LDKKGLFDEAMSSFEGARSIYERLIQNGFLAYKLKLARIFIEIAIAYRGTNPCYGISPLEKAETILRDPECPQTDDRNQLLQTSTSILDGLKQMCKDS